ncbi:hypothetical protein ES705_37659 [subsurface metagenome]
MKCPLSITGELAPDKEFIGAAADCLKEECAWWDEHGGFCAILKVSRHLEALGINAEELLEKMPHESQFRR